MIVGSSMGILFRIVNYTLVSFRPPTAIDKCTTTLFTTTQNQPLGCSVPLHRTSACHYLCGLIRLQHPNVIRTSGNYAINHKSEQQTNLSILKCRTTLIIVVPSTIAKGPPPANRERKHKYIRSDGK